MLSDYTKCRKTEDCTCDLCEVKAYARWADSVEMLPLSELPSVIKRENILTPKDEEVSMVCNTLEDFQYFCSKLEGLEYVEHGWIKELYCIDLEDEEEYAHHIEMEYKDTHWMHSKDAFYTEEEIGKLSSWNVNPYQQKDKRFIIEAFGGERARRKPSSIVLNREIEFPCLAVYNGEESRIYPLNGNINVQWADS